MIVETIIFDLTGLKFIKLGGLLSFLSLCGAIREGKLRPSLDNSKIYLDYPRSDNVMQYLHKMQFFKIACIYNFIENIEDLGRKEYLGRKDEKYYEGWQAKMRWDNSENRYRN